MSDSPATCVDGGNALSQNMAEETIFTIIILDTHLNGMAAWADLMRYSTVQMKCSILGTYYFLDAQLRFIPRSVISMRSSSKYL